jgi:DNA polymerase I-like protein with 3'-5' exonuclease and polymerase domains
LVRLSQEIQRQSLDARVVASIHDAIWIETALDLESEIRTIMEENMTTAMSLAVPLPVDFEL